MANFVKSAEKITTFAGRQLTATAVYTLLTAFIANNAVYVANEQRQALMADDNAPNEDILHHQETFDGIELRDGDDLYVAFLYGLALRLAVHVIRKVGNKF